ncbi:MAG: hypothetical protein ABI601_19835 [bacterium]
MSRCRTAAQVVLMLLGASSVAPAQHASSATAAVRRQASDALPDAATVRDSVVESPSGIRRAIDRLPVWSAPLASLVVPGVGQARLHQGRAIAYLAAESFLLLQYGKDLREGHLNERDYREIARTIARRNFAAAPPDTIWQYYEKLTEYIESGAFTTATSGATVPEPDPTTYNGFQWLLARSQFGVPDDPSERGSARYQRALELYESRAVRQPYRWSWRNAQLEKDLYARTISRTNDAYRRATLDLSAVIANHLLSAIDAFAMVRLSPAPGGSVRVSTTITVP